MGRCVKKECYYCKETTYFYVNIDNYKCTKCGRTFSHKPIDEKYTTGYDYKMKAAKINKSNN